MSSDISSDVGVTEASNFCGLFKKKYSTRHKLYMIMFADPGGTPQNLNFSLCVLETYSSRFCICTLYDYRVNKCFRIRPKIEGLKFLKYRSRQKLSGNKADGYSLELPNQYFSFQFVSRMGQG